MCRVPHCQLGHYAHYCFACQKNDVDHSLKDCPKRHSMKLYHGTTREKMAMDKILTFGLRDSSHGNLGMGVYMVHDYEVAKKIAKHRGKNWAVIEAVVDLGKCQSNYALSHTDPQGQWRTSFDSIYRRHPPWAGVGREFREFCIKSANVAVTQAWYENWRGKEVSAKRPLCLYQIGTAVAVTTSLAAAMYPVEFAALAVVLGCIFQFFAWARKRFGTKTVIIATVTICRFPHLSAVLAGLWFLRWLSKKA